MTSAFGTTPFLASPAERVALQEAAQRVQRARLESEPSRRVSEPVTVAASVAPDVSAEGAAAVGSSALPPAAGAERSAPPGGRGGESGKGSSFDGVRQETELTEEERKQVEELKARDKEVRAHETAHKSAGGQYTRGSASFDYQTGPDGKRYAIGGEVKIDTGKEDEPEKTLEKAEVIRRAAMAPAEPSDKDRQVAADAARMASEARMEISQARAAEARGEAPDEEGEVGVSGEVAAGGESGEEGVSPSGIGGDQEGARFGRRGGGAGFAAYGALNQFNDTANAGRSNNLFVNVYA